MNACYKYEFNKAKKTNFATFPWRWELNGISQPEITCSKLTIEALGQGMKYVQS